MNPLALQIQDEIKREGPISFARLMELALYAPGIGYYERQREIGRHGDFFTSVSVGPVFGELLAFQFAQWLEESSFDRLEIVEAGAHDGSLAADIFSWMRWWRLDIFSKLEYCIVEPSPMRRGWQEQKLRDWQTQIKWIARLSELGSKSVYRIIFSNELLDAMPVHRFSWDGQNWQECRVACEGGKFVWQLAVPTAGLVEALPRIAPELATVIPRGYIFEHSPAAVAWWKKAAETLGHGKLLTIDYGLTEAELLCPERRRGTLRTLAGHHGAGDVLDHPGECDISAHINFSAIEAAGFATGLITDGLMTQEKFLTQILAKSEAAPGSFAPWTPARIKQFQTLTHPEHLGRNFRVLVQMKK